MATKAVITNSLLTDVADAIREKLGVADTYTPGDMPAAIRSISGGGGNIEAGITFDTFNERNQPTHADVYPMNEAVWLHACSSQSTIESVTFHGTVKTIENYAFQSCVKLALTSLPDTITRISSYAFSFCNLLALTRLPSALINLDNSAFRQSGIAIDTIPSGVSVFSDETFYGCTGITSITAPGINVATSGATSQRTFYQCTNLKTVDVNHPARFHTNFFTGCTALDTLIIRQTDAVCSIYNTNAFQDTPIRNGSGKVYVPQALVSAYQNATHWSAYVSAGTQILPIEGSIYETQYANGQPVAA